MLDLLSAAAAQGAAPGWTGFLPIIGMVAIFWFLLIRPQMRQQKQHREKVAGLKKGDRVHYVETVGDTGPTASKVRLGADQRLD